MIDPKLKLKKIVKRVLTLHVLLLLFMMIHFKPPKKKALHTKRVLKENVRIIEKNRPKKVVAQVKKAPPKPSAKKAVATPKKPAVKAPVKVASDKPLPKIEKMPERPKEEMAAIVLPKAIAKLDIEAVKVEAISEVDVDEEVGGTCGRYGENVRMLFEQALNLKPGAYVSIELSLNKKGEVIEVKHLHSSDVLSKDKVLQKIKEIKFPDFFGEIANESEYTLVLTLKDKVL